MLAIIIVVFVMVAASKIEANKINCDGIESYLDIKQCCVLNNTIIRANDETFEGQEEIDVDGIRIDNNQTQFLPVEVYKKFPNLEFYLTSSTSVKKISALNFERLFSLKYLDLQLNQIEYIPDGCFANLFKLNVILLGDNKIKEMNGAAIFNLPQLVIIDLRGNVCIDKLFATESDIKSLRRKVTENCAVSGTAKKISCKAYSDCYESVDLVGLDHWNDYSSCCRLEYGTYIDSPDYTFDSNMKYVKLEMLIMTHQKNIEFLPISVHENFPILKAYLVIDAPIRMISKKNFEKLYQLEKLLLESNQIEVIKSNTFEDLISLTEINISNQRLTALNAKAFSKLSELHSIHLINNNCINREFAFDPSDRGTYLEDISNSCGFEENNHVEVACEKYADYESYGLQYSSPAPLTVESCFMTEQTAINDTQIIVMDIRIEVEGIIFENNKKIEYLPYKIHLQLPNLYTYVASNCSIKQISKENFQQLNRLKIIDLSLNLIKKISGNTFKGLRSLTEISLGGNQIKSINGRTFDQIPLMVHVDLSSNECMNEILDPEEPQLMKHFTRKIINKCSFTETGEREFEKVFDIECGVGKSGSGFVVGGNETERGQWPFMSALMLQPKNHFFCGGNIITTSHILTAAHCIQNKHKEKPFEASQILILLGRFNISLSAELGSEIRGVKKIQTHPLWSPSDSKYKGDIAVLEMDRAVQFSELIQPVCLTVEPQLSDHEAGYVIGWGKSDSSALHETVPRQVLISSVTSEVCFETDHKLGSMFSQGMFCAGGDGAGPCTGDSGGGYFVRYHGLWTLRGIVSSGTSKTEGGCDVGRYSLFTNVLDYTSWTAKVIDKNAVSISQSFEPSTAKRRSGPVYANRNTFV